jgi:hypothetical protein
VLSALLFDVEGRTFQAIGRDLGRRDTLVELKLFYEKVGASYADIVARVRSDGGIEMDCGFGGPDIQAMSGDYDDEFHYTVAARHKDRLLLELMREVFGGDRRAGSRFKDWLEAHSIPYDFAYF